MRNKIVAGNWKMNLSFSEAVTLNSEINKALETGNSNCEIYHFVSALYLHELLKTEQKAVIGAQNGHPEKKGAFTGEISMSQLAGMGVKAVLVGHSERRQIFGETEVFLKEKIDAALAEKMTVFFCCGETLEQRENGDYEAIIIRQLENSLFHLSAADFKNVVIAYEPVWAIGTGKTATPEQANAIHKSIRKAIAQKYSAETAENTSILYGGSCNPTNAPELFAQPDIDGGLIGGAALKAADFLSIISNY